MPTRTAVDEVHRVLADLLDCVTALMSTCGDTPAMRRIVNDTEGIRNGVARLEIDAEEVGLTAPAVGGTRSVQMIQIAEADYDAGFWRDVDHEGVGAQSLAAGHVARTRR